MIKIAVLKVGQPLSVQEIDGGLKSMQQLVGGFIQMVPISDGIELVCNEEGKFAGLPVNFKLGMDRIVGDVFFTRTDDEGEPASLTDEDLSYLNEWTRQMRTQPFSQVH